MKPRKPRKQKFLRSSKEHYWTIEWIGTNPSDSHLLYHPIGVYYWWGYHAHPAQALTTMLFRTRKEAAAFRRERKVHGKTAITKVYVRLERA